MRDEEFEWDDNKASNNFIKHKVTFEQARAAFDDPNHVEVDDPDPYELRFNRLCWFEDVVLMITYTERGDRIRIISARPANTHEQRTYFEG